MKYTPSQYIDKPETGNKTMIGVCKLYRKYVHFVFTSYIHHFPHSYIHVAFVVLLRIKQRKNIFIKNKVN